MAALVGRDWHGAISDLAFQRIGDFQKYRGFVSNRVSGSETRQRGLNAAAMGAV